MESFNLSAPTNAMNHPIASDSAFSAFFRNLPDTLRQPFSLALIGSVGAHVFFFLWLPLLSPPEAQPEVKRVVRLLNSSPQAQASTSSLGLPPIPKTPTSRVEIPLGQSLTPPIPPDASLYKFQDPILSPAPPVVRFSQQPTRIFSYPPIAQNFNPPPNLPLSQNPRTTRTLTQPPSTTPMPPSNGKTDPNVSPLDPGVTAGSVAQAPTSQTPAAASPTSPTAPPTPTPARPGERLLAENLRLRESLTFKPPGATPTEIESNNLDNYAKWFEKNVTALRIPEGNLAEKEVLVPDVPYNLPFNLTEKFQPAYINVLIAPDGSIARPDSDGSIASPELVVTGHTGYGILDDLAVQEVFRRVSSDQKEGKLKPTGDQAGKYVLYKYKVTFKGVRTA